MPTRCCLPCFLHHKHCGSERSIYGIPTCFIYKVNICALISQMWKWSPRASKRLDDFTWDLVAGGGRVWIQIFWAVNTGLSPFGHCGAGHLFSHNFWSHVFPFGNAWSTVENCLMMGFRVRSTWSDWETTRSSSLFALQWKHGSPSRLPWEHQHWSHHALPPHSHQSSLDPWILPPFSEPSPFLPDA